MFTSSKKRRELILNLEKLIKRYNLDNHSDLIYKIIEEKVEENNC